jgi:DNA-binding transcriptional MerR regulator
MVENLIPIGQFAGLSRLSLKALRLYGLNGLLPPAHVDPDSGYRYYRVEQLREAALIRLLRAGGMSLEQIRVFLDDPRPDRLDEHLAALSETLTERQRVLRYVRQLLSRKEDVVSYEVKVKEVAAQPYVSLTKRVSIEELEPFISSTIGELWHSHEPADHAFTLYHGEVNEDSDGPVEVCVPTKEPVEGGGELPAGPVAYTVARGEQTRFPEIIGAYDAVALWVQRHGHELAGPPREIYRSDPAKGEEAVMEIAWPIR